MGDEWNVLAQRFQTPLLRHEWFLACAAAFCPPGALRVITVRSHGNLTAIAPLMAVRRAGVERLELLGTSILFEPSGFLYADEEALQDVLDAVTAMRQPLLLRRVPADAAEARLCSGVCHLLSLFPLTRVSRSPWLPIISGWDDYEASLSASQRSSLRRARRRAEEAGPVHLEWCTPPRERLYPYLRALYCVEASGWKGRYGTAIRSHPSVKYFFDLYAQAATDSGMLRIGLLKINGTVVAALLAVEYARRLWILKVGYDEAWRQCSPGKLLMHESLRYAFERELEAYEFLGSDEPWLRMWTDQVHNYVTYRLYPFSWNSLFWTGVDGVRLLRQKLRRRFQ